MRAVKSQHEYLTIRDGSDEPIAGAAIRSTLNDTLAELGRRGRKVLGFERRAKINREQQTFEREWLIKLMAVA